MTAALAKEETPAIAQYGFGVRLRGETMEEARAKVIAALGAEGFTVLTEIDVQATLETELGPRMPPYRILGACHPRLARLAIEREPYVGLFLPCNVTLWKEGVEVVVTAASPVALLGLAADPRLTDVARETETRLRGALERILE
jgi:uncharacterized protein (DUF302 family)